MFPSKLIIVLVIFISFFSCTNGGDKNGTILEHYGDVLFKIGDVTQAVTYWNQAKATGDR